MRAVVLLLTVVLSSVMLHLLGPHALTAVRTPAPARLEDAVTEAAVVVATALAGWYLATAVVALLAVLLQAGSRALGRRGATRARGGRVARAGALLDGAVHRFGAPLLRRGVALGIGLGLAAGGAPALADPGALDEVPLDLRPGASVDAPASDDVIAPAPEPSRTAGDDAPQPEEPPDGTAADPVEQQSAAPAPPGERSATTTPAPGPTPPGHGTTLQETPASGPGSFEPQPSDRLVSPAQVPAPGQQVAAGSGPAAGDEPGDRSGHTVAPGENLWRIAAARLGPGATDEAIASEWPRWYAANAAVIGPDPNLIHPGQELLAPPKEAGP